MNKYKVTKNFSYVGVATITAPNLEAAGELAKKLDNFKFRDCYDWYNSEQSYIYSVTQEPDDAPKKVIWLYGLTQSCLDKKGQHAVSSVDEIDTRYHWVDIEKLSNDKNAYWLELVEKYGWEVDEMHGE